MRARPATGSADGPQPEAGLERLRAFFGERIWAVPAERAGRGRALLYRVSRIAYATVSGFVAHRLTIRAAALTYSTALSLVPFLAFTFAMLKGFGAYASFIHATVQPYLEHTFGGNPALLESIERILNFVDHTNLSALGAIGLVTLVYTSVSLLGSVEDTLNEIWGARARRSFLRQVTDYVTLLVTAPLLIVAATTAASAAQSSRLVGFLRDALALGPVIDFLLHFTSLATVGLAFFAVYIILPNVRTRPASALLGAAVGALLWHAALVGYVRFQIGVSSYNALYSVLSAIPIFLVWTYVCWLVLLIGAQVAAGHQNERALRQQLRASHLDQALREELAVLLAAHVARDALTGAPRRAARQLAAAADAPELVIQDVLDALARADVLVRTDGPGPRGYVPAHDVDAVRLSDVRDALRRDPAADPLRAGVERRLGPRLREALASVEEDARGAPRNVSLRELAALLEDAPEPAGAGRTVDTSPALTLSPVPPRPVQDAK